MARRGCKRFRRTQFGSLRRRPMTLAERLNLPRSAVRIVAGEKCRPKRIEIAGVTRAQVIEMVERCRT
jgi:hypothetical protein